MRLTEISGKIYYHGTSSIYLEKIIKNGIIPNTEYFSNSVFVTGSYSEAEKYAKGTVKINGGSPIVIIVRISNDLITIDDASSAEQDAYIVDGEISPLQIVNIIKV